MIVITAATGQYGRAAVHHLLARIDPAQVAVAVRNPAGAGDLKDRGVEVRYADYEQPHSLRSAFAGAERVLFVSAPTWDSAVRRPQHENVVAAARAAGVGLLAYTSALGADVSDEGGLSDHHYTEELIRDSGLDHLILRHPFYSENFIHPGLQDVLERGELVASTGGHGVNTATRSDLAEAASALLCSPRLTETAVNFTGPVWTYAELAEVLSEMAGRPVRYRDEGADVDDMEFVGPLLRAGALEWQTPDLERALGHSAMGLRETVHAALHSRATTGARG